MDRLSTSRASAFLMSYAVSSREGGDWERRRGDDRIRVEKKCTRKFTIKSVELIHPPQQYPACMLFSCAPMIHTILFARIVADDSTVDGVAELLVHVDGEDVALAHKQIHEVTCARAHDFEHA